MTTTKPIKSPLSTPTSTERIKTTLRTKVNTKWATSSSNTSGLTRMTCSSPFTTKLIKANTSYTLLKWSLTSYITGKIGTLGYTLSSERTWRLWHSQLCTPRWRSCMFCSKNSAFYPPEVRCANKLLLFTPIKTDVKYKDKKYRMKQVVSRTPKCRMDVYS